MIGIQIVNYYSVVLVVKSPPDNAGGVRDKGLIPGLERFPWTEELGGLQSTGLQRARHN